jgi:glycosyltransferase involved in cell wall biosynthesis
VSLPARTVCLDVQGAQNSTHLDRGIPRFVVEHARALVHHDRAALHSVLLSPQRPLTGNLNWLLGSELLGWATSDRRPTRQPRTPPSIYHVMSPFELERPLDELWPRWARNAAVQTVVTLYDLIPLVFAEHYLRDPVMRQHYLTRTRIVRNADRVLAISQATAEDAVERLEVEPDRVTVIDAGATSTFARMYQSRAQAERVLADRLRVLRPGFMLYVAGFEFRKNLERLIAAYGLLPEKTRTAHQLVIACRLLPSEADTLRGWAADAGVGSEQLVLTGYVTDAELGALYHACKLFVFASFYEGSGLPILEAMSCGSPIIASRTSTGPEILGDLEGTFDPLDPSSIAACIQDVLASTATLERLIDRSRQRVSRYTWEHVAERTVEGYRQTLRTVEGYRQTPQTHHRRARRHRLALVTPWPPEQSGIADYSYRVARELGQWINVDVIVGNPLSSYAEPLEDGVTLVEASSFSAGHRVRQHDRIMYCMGNSSFHRHVYELLRKRPGAVVAHDVRLTGFYGWFAGLENPDDPAKRLSERIRALYGPRIPEATLAMGPPDPEIQCALGIFMTREIQQYAEQLFVHSRFALDVLELDRGVADRDVPVTILPFGIPEMREKGEDSLGGPPLVISVGVVSEVKGLADLIEAFALLAERHPEARLVIAGPAEKQELERWRGYAREHAPAADVQIPGHLSEELFHELLVSADIAVQLRTVSNGEASAAVADCLSAGLPTIVSALGWAAELPDGVVEKVPTGAGAELIAERIHRLLTNGAARQDLQRRASAYTQARSFRHVAEAYIDALELA